MQKYLTTVLQYKCTVNIPLGIKLVLKAIILDGNDPSKSFLWSSYWTAFVHNFEMRTEVLGQKYLGSLKERSTVKLD